jgi:hypothetical protein
MRHEPIELRVSPQGEVRCIYHEELEFDQLGTPVITRASHVEPTDDGRWTADLTPVGGPVLGPFAFRSNALSIERRWLAMHWLNTSLENDQRG